MSRKCAVSFLSLVLMLALAAGISLAQGSQPLPARSTAEEANPQAALGGGFTYQGWLKGGDGNPVTGTCDLSFALWDAGSGGSQLGADEIVTGVDVADGYFAALLNASGEFGADAFDGEARWLKIGVKCSGDADWSYLPGRQLLSATPYALGLRPGATVSGAMSGGNGLTVINTATSGESNGVYGRSTSADGYGGYFENTATSGESNGVHGRAASADGYGGYFENTAGGPALYAAGDVAQDAGAAGLVKAAVYVDCHSPGTADPHRSFNTVSGEVRGVFVNLMISGHCVLDFDFDLSQRFWVAMAYNNTNATTVSCTLSSVHNDELICDRWDKDGIRTNGDIMVLVY